MQSLIKISVIIPTYHDWERLSICLQALEKQTFPNDSFEIIVVNNDPLNQPLLSYYLPNNCRIIKEDQPGSYAARNAGAKKAQGKILSFTDSDCIPDEMWLYNIARHFEKKSGILTGKVEMFSVKNNKYLNFSESYDFVFGINQELYAKKKTGATANLSVTHQDFYKINGFNDVFSGGDIDFCKRAVSANIDFKYLESVKVKHPLRYDLKNILIKARRGTGSRVKLNKFKGVFLAMSPPLVRLNILFFKKKAPFYIKIKAFVLIFYVKVHQIITAFKVFSGALNERN